MPTPAFVPDELAQPSGQSDARPAPIILLKPKRKNSEVDPRGRPRSLVIGVAAGLIYGVVARILLGASPFPSSPIFGSSTMTYAFLGLVPMCIGALSVAFTPLPFRTRYSSTHGYALLTTIIFLAVVCVVGLELWICIAMASPLVLLMSSIGAWLTCWLFRQIDRGRTGERTKNFVLALVMLAPFLLSPVENQLPVPTSIREVPTQITIHASAPTIWRNIVRVPAIQPWEYSFSFAQLIGIPRPLEATLKPDYIGHRYATFTDGLAFDESIGNWQVNQFFDFKIRVDPNSRINPPFDQIGGPNFEVLDGKYTLEPISNGDVILHLSSHERLSTHFNGYAGLWTDFLMADLQNNILRVIKARAERGDGGD